MIHEQFTIHLLLLCSNYGFRKKQTVLRFPPDCQFYSNFLLGEWFFVQIETIQLFFFLKDNQHFWTFLED